MNRTISQFTTKTLPRPNFILGSALKMYNYGFVLFPTAGVINGTCECPEGIKCNSIGKHPAVKNWQEFRFQDEASIRQYWALNPNKNFGINAKGLVILDFDERNGGFESYKKYFQKLIESNPTFTVQTGSGQNSFHIYYKSIKKFYNNTKLFPGVDIKTNGGLTIGPGSRHKSGEVYKILHSGTDNTDIINVAELPIDIERIILEKQNDNACIKNHNNMDIKAALVFDANILKGQRNTTLFTRGSQLRQKGLTVEEIRPILNELNTNKCIPPLKDSELEAILGSINNYPMGNIANWNEPNLNYNLKDPALPDIKEDHIPKILRNYTLKKSRSLGIPRSTILVSAMTYFSALLGTVYKVRPKSDNDYSVSLNLWGLIVAMPSSRKTAALEIFKRPLALVQDFFLQKRNNFISQKRESLAKINAEKENLKKSALKEKNNDEFAKKLRDLEIELEKLKDTPTPCWIFAIGDSTPEALITSFMDNSRGILFFRDEMQGLFSMLVKNGYENLRSLLIEAWNGNKPYSINRIQRGLISIPSMTLSVLGGVQPDVLYSVFSDELTKGVGGDGLVQRFQLISQYSLSQVTEPDDLINLEVEQFEMDNLINAIHILTKDKNLEPTIQPTYLTLSSDAYKSYKNYRDHLNTLIRRDDITNSAYLAHLGKLDRLVLSLAGQFHILNSVIASETIKSEIDLEFIDEAIQVAKHMESQIFHLYFKVGKNLHAKALLAKIRSKDIRDGMSVRSIYKRQWSYLKNSDDLLSAIEEISDSNWVQVVKETPKGGGAPTNILKLNPKLIEFLNTKNSEGHHE